MSYEIIKSIKIKDDKVYLNSTCSNTFSINPYTGREYREFREIECSTLTDILKNKGREALDLEILKEYENGNMQRGTNKYTRALKVLHNMPEYADFSWRNRGEAYEKANELRKTTAFDELLSKALNKRLPKDKYIIKKTILEKRYMERREEILYTGTEKKQRRRFSGISTKPKDILSVLKVLTHGR